MIMHKNVNFRLQDPLSPDHGQCIFPDCTVCVWWLLSICFYGLAYFSRTFFLERNFETLFFYLIATHELVHVFYTCFIYLWKD